MVSRSETEGYEMDNGWQPVAGIQPGRTERGHRGRETKACQILDRATGGELVSLAS